MTETTENAEKQVKIIIQEDTNYKELAKEVADVIKNDYGMHNAFDFLQELRKQLIIN